MVLCTRLFPIKLPSSWLPHPWLVVSTMMPNLATITSPWSSPLCYTRSVAFPGHVHDGSDESMHDQIRNQNQCHLFWNLSIYCPIPDPGTWSLQLHGSSFMAHYILLNLWNINQALQGRGIMVLPINTPASHGFIDNMTNFFNSGINWDAPPPPRSHITYLQRACSKKHRPWKGFSITRQVDNSNCQSACTPWRSSIAIPRVSQLFDGHINYRSVIVLGKANYLENSPTGPKIADALHQ